MKIFYAIIIAALFNLPAAAQIKPVLTDNPLKDHLDSAVHKGAMVYMQNAGTVGLSIGVYKNGRNYIYNYGESVKGSGRLPTPDQMFNLGSVAKTFVGTMLAEAVLENKTRLTDDIRLYLPGKYPNLEYQATR
jgi:CubicO group peptidase (beta-lactamase class C family)